MKIIKIKYSPERRYFQFFIIGGQKDLIDFLEELEIPTGTNIKYKFLKKNKIKMSMHISSKKKFEQLYKRIDIVALEYI